MSDDKSVSGYRVFTTAFDLEVTAAELLSQVSASPRGDEAALSTRPDELAPLLPHFGKRPLVTILVDHSGSLRGEPARWMVTALRTAGTLLERAGVPFELLGFTTVRWHGGRAKRQWLEERQNGRWTPFPGRLCDLLHIVYQDASAQFSSWANNLELLNVSDLLKENVDGEALLWARRRAMAFQPDFWLCVVVSDGAPVDDSTLEANADWDANDPYPILITHLREVIAALDRVPNTQIAGFGVNYDVSSFYEDSCFADIKDDEPSKLADFVRQLMSGTAHA